MGSDQSDLGHLQTEHSPALKRGMCWWGHVGLGTSEPTNYDPGSRVREINPFILKPDHILKNCIIAQNTLRQDYITLESHFMFWCSICQVNTKNMTFK